MEIVKEEGKFLAIHAIYILWGRITLQQSIFDWTLQICCSNDVRNCSQLSLENWHPAHIAHRGLREIILTVPCDRDEQLAAIRWINHHDQETCQGLVRDLPTLKTLRLEDTYAATSQEAFSGPWPARTLESGLSIVNLNRKSGLQSPGRPGSQKCLLGYTWKSDPLACLPQ